MADQIVGYSLEDLDIALQAVEPHLNAGKPIELVLCTERLPTEEDLANFVIDADRAGFKTDFPSVDLNSGIPVTRVVLSYDLSNLGGSRLTTGALPAAIIPLIGLLGILGVITFGIVKLDDITSSLMPLVLAVGGVLIIVLALARKPTENIAVKYFERGGQTPLNAKIRYLPSTVSADEKLLSPQSESIKPECDLGLIPRTEKPYHGWSDYELQQKYPDKQLKALAKLKPYLMMKKHENGDVTILCKGKPVRVNTEGSTDIEPYQPYIEFMARTKHDPYAFAESVLAGNLFEESDLPIYSGKSGKDPLGVPDAIWEHVFLGAGGKWVKMGDLYTVAGGEPSASPGLAPKTVKMTDLEELIIALRNARTPEDQTWIKLTAPKSVMDQYHGLSAKQIIEIENKYPLELQPATYPKFVEVISSGDTELVPGSVISQEAFDKANARVTKLGLTPARAYSTPQDSRVRDGLEKSIKEEKKAESDYRARAEIAGKEDKEIAKLYNHIADEERRHAEEFTTRLNKLRSEGLNFMPDSPEFLTETISTAGWRDKLDQAFQSQIARVRGS